MTLRRRVKQVGGSLGVLIPRDFAEAMKLRAGSEVRLTLVGNQVVVEPVEGSLDDGAFRRAFATVLRRHRRGFELLAEYDRGDWRPQQRLARRDGPRKRTVQPALASRVASRPDRSEGG